MASPRMVGGPVLQAESGLNDLYLKVAIGATGAPTIDTNIKREISAITRLGAGNYQIALRESWTALMDAAILVLDPSAAATDGLVAHLTVVTLGATSSPVIEFQVRRIDTGAAADPRNGASLIIRLRLMNGMRV